VPQLASTRVISTIRFEKNFCFHVNISGHLGSEATRTVSWLQTSISPGANGLIGSCQSGWADHLEMLKLLNKGIDFPSRRTLIYVESLACRAKKVI
jgi:hypothetical protein